MLRVERLRPRGKWPPLAHWDAGRARGVGPQHPNPAFGSANVRQLGCLDLAFEFGGDRRIPDDALLLDVHLRNRCTHPVALDLTALVIVGRDAEGPGGRMTFYDPRHEIQPIAVDAPKEAKERIRLDGTWTDCPGEIVTLCFDVSRVAPDTPAASPTPLCIQRSWVSR